MLPSKSSYPSGSSGSNPSKLTLCLDTNPCRWGNSWRASHSPLCYLGKPQGNMASLWLCDVWQMQLRVFTIYRINGKQKSMPFLCQRDIVNVTLETSHWQGQRSFYATWFHNEVQYRWAHIRYGSLTNTFGHSQHFLMHWFCGIGHCIGWWWKSVVMFWLQ